MQSFGRLREQLQPWCHKAYQRTDGFHASASFPEVLVDFNSIDDNIILSIDDKLLGMQKGLSHLLKLLKSSFPNFSQSSMATMTTWDSK